MNKARRFGWPLIVAALALVVLYAAQVASQQDPQAPAPDYQIRLKTRTFTPPEELAAPKSLEVQSKRSTAHVVVQFYEMPTPQQHERLEKSGVKLLSYLGGTSYWASVPTGKSLEAVAGPKVFRWVGSLTAADKVHPNVPRAIADDTAEKRSAKARAMPMDVEARESVTGPALLVEIFKDVPSDVVSAEFKRLEVAGEPYGPHTWLVKAGTDRANAIAALDIVKQVQRGPTPFLPLNDTGRILVRSDLAQQGLFSAPQPTYRTDGFNADLGICDSGVDQDHDDFDTITAAGAAGVSRVYNQRPGSGSHGTHVASIAAGSGLNSVGDGRPAFSLRGHAPRADIGDYPSFGSAAASYLGAIVTDGTDVTNHSYVQSMSVYDAQAGDIDEIVRGAAVSGTSTIPARPQVWAAGNNGTGAQYGNEEGYYAVFTSAKNTISVGSLDSLDGRLSDYSSLGPTFDGRIKPDISAPGCRDSIGVGGIRAASNGTQGYTDKCGTSMAAPLVTGLVGLAMNQYEQSYGVFPNLFPSTYKAMLVHTAQDLIKTRAHATREFNNPDTGTPVLYYEGPDFATGYGMVDAEGLRDMVPRSSQWRESQVAATGSSRTYCFSVPAGSGPVKVTLAWDDVEGDTTTAETAAKLVNDLDLAVYDPNGVRHDPWTLDPLPLTATPGDGAADPITPANVVPARRAADHRNNVEMVTSCGGPVKGQWRAVVRGHSLPLGSAQSFSIVGSHPFLRLCKKPPPSFCTRYPHLCPVRNICDRFPSICEERVVLIPKKDFWEIGGGGAVPIPEICKYVINCPGCEGGAGGYCPGWCVDMRGLPPDVIASAINDDGQIIKEKRQGEIRTVNVPRRRADDDWHIMFTDTAGKPVEKTLKVKFEVKPPAR